MHKKYLIIFSILAVYVTSCSIFHGSTYYTRLAAMRGYDFGEVNVGEKSNLIFEIFDSEEYLGKDHKNYSDPFCEIENISLSDTTNFYYLYSKMHEDPPYTEDEMENKRIYDYTDYWHNIQIVFYPQTPEDFVLTVTVKFKEKYNLDHVVFTVTGQGILIE